MTTPRPKKCCLSPALSERKQQQENKTKQQQQQGITPPGDLCVFGLTRFGVFFSLPTIKGETHKRETDSERYCTKKLSTGSLSLSLKQRETERHNTEGTCARTLLRVAPQHSPSPSGFSSSLYLSASLSDQRQRHKGKGTETQTKADNCVCHDKRRDTQKGDRL